MKKTPPKVEMSYDQKIAVAAILDFHKSKKPLVTLGGFAGVGKTTTIVEAVRKLDGKKRPAIAFCAFTGRAASVLRGKLEKAEVLEMTDFAGTIHSLIYKPIVKNGVVVGWEKKTVGDMTYDLIVVDEASMLNETLFKDLSSFSVPMIAVGDHGQLPPIEGGFNLMQNPDIRLEKIHRQAEGDPIIKLSMIVREGGSIPVGRHGEFVSKTRDRDVLDRVNDVSDAMILCGYNRTRTGLNAYIRRRLGRTERVPAKGERIICLKNNHGAAIYNGMLGVLRDVTDGGKDHLVIDADMEGGARFQGNAYREQFGAERTVKPVDKMDAKRIGDLFDWGYAMTVHKSQGSEARRVVLFEERLPKSSDEDWKRWLYTGVTRARERLLVIGA